MGGNYQLLMDEPMLFSNSSAPAHACMHLHVHALLLLGDVPLKLCVFPANEG